MQITAADIILTIKNSQEFAKWLEKNPHAQSVWVRIYKKDSGKQTFTYEQAVEGALCYGWIDGIAKRYDSESYIQRFTPRKAKSNWTPTNIAKVKRLFKEKRMKLSGIQKAKEAGILLK